jgi:hypothetical protein
LNVAHFYHCFTGGSWTEPVLEHVDALLAADWSAPVYLGLVGAKLWRDAARDAFDPLDVRVAVEADEGFEQVTLKAVREYALEHDGAVCYAHTKGAQDVTDFRAKWRRSMTKLVVRDWRINLKHLERFDAVGCHWLTREVYGPKGFEQEFSDGTPFFGGNFWMARCDYLRTLPEPSTRSRFDAERWIGLGQPTVKDLNKGWPAAELFV